MTPTLLICKCKSIFSSFCNKAICLHSWSKKQKKTFSILKAFQNSPNMPNTKEILWPEKCLHMSYDCLQEGLMMRFLVLHLFNVIVSLLA